MRSACVALGPLFSPGPLSLELLLEGHSVILFVPGSEVGDLEAMVRRATRREESRGGAGPGGTEWRMTGLALMAAGTLVSTWARFLLPLP